eukprot:SAG31_NODE_603_length_13622_cov_19.019953_12_plen_148_part_00
MCLRSCQLDAELALTPADNGLTIQGEPGKTILIGGIPLRLHLTPLEVSRAAALRMPEGTMSAKLPPGTGRFAALYEDPKLVTGDDDPGHGARLPWAREPNGQVETDLQPQNLARAQGTASDPRYPEGMFYNDSGSMYRWAAAQASRC